MSKYTTTLPHSDGASRILKAVEKLREIRDTSVLHDLTFIPYMHRLTEEQRDQAEADLQYKFRLWWSTWVEAKLQAIEAELPNIFFKP